MGKGVITKRVTEVSLQSAENKDVNPGEQGGGAALPILPKKLYLQNRKVVGAIRYGPKLGVGCGV